MYRPRFNSFINNRQNFSDSTLYPQWNANNRNHYTPNRFNYQQFAPFGVSPESNAFNNEYWCETCDRGFRTQYILENHKKEHQKCNIDGCPFIAHPKVITKHIQMQHSTGLYKKIAKLNNPEEIEKWREERRKKYPTKSNIEKKNFEIQEKIERGEKMDIKYSKKIDINHKRNGVGLNNSRKDNRLLKRNFPIRSSNKQSIPKKVVKFEIDQEVRQLKPFRGIQQLIEDTEDREPSSPDMKDFIEDDEFVDIQNNTKPENKPVMCKALVSLINDYGSSDEEDKKEELIISNSIHEQKHCNILARTNKNIIIEKTDQTLIKRNMVTDQGETLNNHLKSTGIDEDDDSGPEEIKVVKEINTPISINNTNETKPRKELINSNKYKHRMHDRSNPNNQYKRKLPSTLLEKLLSSEIQNERNAVLQCIRYIIRNNYFNKVNNDYCNFLLLVLFAIIILFYI